MGKIVKTIIWYLNIIFIVAAIVLMFFYDKLGALNNYVTEERILAFILALGASFFLYFDKITKNIEEKITSLMSFKDSFTHKKLTNSMDAVSSKRKKYKTLRVFAHSSKKIFEIYEDKEIFVESCHLLLREFTVEELMCNYNIEEKQNIARTIKQWAEYKNRGKIKNLYLYRYDFNSTEYQMIFDDEIMISGTYYPNKNSGSRQSVIDPIYVECTTKECKLLINNYIKRFDKIVDYYGTTKEIL